MGDGLAVSRTQGGQHVMDPDRSPTVGGQEVPTTDLSQVRQVQVQVHQGEAQLYLNL